ncbi:MAG TPA: hypothetical protein VIZ69_05585, partial [Thermoanaerobaculia bacterium]
AAACTVTVAPVVAKDPEIACPGGATSWRLAIADQRADRRDTEKVVRAIRESIARSLPGCQWVEGAAPEISIEIHRFDVRQQEGTWEAQVELTVIARDRGGRTLTEFQADASIARPEYRGLDNEKLALQEALADAMRRALTGLRAVSNAG